MTLKTLFPAMAMAALFSTVNSQLSTALAQSTAFTYQGRLNSNGGPANGLYDFQFALFNAVTNGSQMTAAMTNSSVSVSNGLFTTAIDFGNVFNGSNYWLAITVSTNGANVFTTLSPRQAITPTPYATYASNAGMAGSANSVSAANIAGSISLAQLPSSIITNGASGLNISGTFTGNGAGVTNVSVNSLVVKTNNSVFAWVNNPSGLTNVPAGLNNVVAVAAGGGYCLALKSDGMVVAWGDNNTYGQTAVPPGLSNVVSVAAGHAHSLALKSDGTVVAWGAGITNNPTDGVDYGQSIIPPGLSNVVSVSAGGYFSLALKSDGSVVAWGDNNFGQATVPAGLSNVVAVAAGDSHSLALKSDGTVIAWGINYNQETSVPAGLSNVVAVSAGVEHSLALKNDGTIIGWGAEYGFGEATIPPGLGNVVAVSAGPYYSVVLKSDGTVVTWGGYGGGNPVIVPSGLNHVIALAQGCYASCGLVIQQAINSSMALRNWDNTFNGNVTVNGVISGNGAGLTNVSVNAAQINGMLSAVQIPSLDASIIVSGTFSAAQIPNLNASKITSGTLSASQVPNLDASKITSGTLSLAQLPASVLTNTETGVTLGGTFNGNGAGLTSLNASQVITGTLPTAQIPSLDASKITSGTLSAARLPANLTTSTMSINTSSTAGTLTLSGTFYQNSPGYPSSTAIIEARSGDQWPLAVQWNNNANLLLIATNRADFYVPVYANSVQLVSDRNAKENFATVNPQSVLEKVASLPMTEWNYKQDAAGQKHLGPMAQDFYAAFGLNGEDDKHISLVDEGGVALTAIQGLNQKLNEKDAEIAELKARLNELEQTVQSLAEKK